MNVSQLIKKMYISIITCVLILCTAITTTYAWFGINNYVNGSEFNMKINDTYGKESLYLSLDGVNFSQTISAVDAMRNQLTQKGLDVSELSDEDVEKEFFVQNRIDAITTNLSSNALLSFEDVFGVSSDRYLYMELYVAVESDDETYTLSSPVYFDKNIVSGQVINHHFPNALYYPVTNETLTSAKINTKNYSRVAVTKHSVVLIGDHFDSETGEIIDVNGNIVNPDLNPTSLIYTPSSNEPSYNSSTDIYNFGGVGVNYNISIDEYNKLHPQNKIYIPASILAREDIVLDDVDANPTLGNECNLIIDVTDQLKNGYMMKLGFYFWIEGWDPDCIGRGSSQQSELSLALTTLNPYNRV